MLKRFFSIFVIIFAVFEILIAMAFIDKFGFLNLFLETIISAVLGLLIVFKFGLLNLTKNFNLFILSGINKKLILMLGGFLIFIPGLLTDSIGVILALFYLFTYKKEEVKFEEKTDFNKSYDNEIIDVEIIQEDKK